MNYMIKTGKDVGQAMEEQLDMNQIVGSHHILMLCLDCLRYDAAVLEQEQGGTPNLNRYGSWRRCQAPGNFTYASHQAIFAGFFPVDEDVREMSHREKLFFSSDIGMGRKAPKEAFHFQGPNLVEGLERVGYETYCIGGVSFFDNRSAVGKVLPSYFMHCDWNPSFGPKVKDSATHQVDVALERLEECRVQQKRVMMYMNISALHYPNYFYIEGETKDNLACHRAALRYVDKELGRLFKGFQSLGDTFVICFSDHGTCYGEDGVWFHGVNHPNVLTVPYKHFVL